MPDLGRSPNWGSELRKRLSGRYLIVMDRTLLYVMDRDPAATHRRPKEAERSVARARQARPRPRPAFSRCASPLSRILASARVMVARVPLLIIARMLPEVVPGLVEVRWRSPRLRPACVVGVGRRQVNRQRKGTTTDEEARSCCPSGRSRRSDRGGGVAGGAAPVAGRDRGRRA